MKPSVIILSCALVAISQSQIGEDAFIEQEIPEGGSKVEITDDPFQQVTFPIMHNLYGKINKYLNGIPLTIQGPFVQNQHQYGSIRNQYGQLDMARTKCGNHPCPRTWFVCQSGPCQYPNEFDDIIVRCRSSLQSSEEQFQSIADLLLSASVKMVRDGAIIKIADAKSLYESTRTILAEVADNIGNVILRT